MCTAISINADNFYFGRNLDVERSYDAKIGVIPRKYPFSFCNSLYFDNHYAIIGVCMLVNNYPLLFDATNEKGLSMAGLSFEGNAVYNEMEEDKDNVSSYEFIPYILSLCKNVKEAKEKLKNINIVNVSFSYEFPPSPLHWIIADKTESITVEQVSDGLKIYNNPVGVLTNNPEFNIQMHNLNNYIGLSRKTPKNSFSKEIELNVYTRGLGALGLPGDMTSSSRFVRAVFAKFNSQMPENEEESITEFFHILDLVYQKKGCVEIDDGVYEFTQYSSCTNTTKGIYYFKTYENNCINAVDMHCENLDTDKIVLYEMTKSQTINFVNRGKN